jgi:hypothetical protein
MHLTNYPANAVVCKLWGHVGSPVEFILALSVYKALSRSYDSWTCWVYSDGEYRQAVAEGGPHQIGLFALVPQLRIDQVGDVDLAVFVPGVIKDRPIVVIEADGHHFHERTVEQASKDADATASSNAVAFQSFASPAPTSCVPVRSARTKSSITSMSVHGFHVGGAHTNHGARVDLQPALYFLARSLRL